MSKSLLNIKLNRTSLFNFIVFSGNSIVSDNIKQYA